MGFYPAMLAHMRHTGQMLRRVYHAQWVLQPLDMKELLVAFVRLSIYYLHTGYFSSHDLKVHRWQYSIQMNPVSDYQHFHFPPLKPRGHLYLNSICRLLRTMETYGSRLHCRHQRRRLCVPCHPFCLLLRPLWESVIVLCFVVCYYMSILKLQSSWWGRESWLLCLICLPGVSWWLSGSSSWCHGVVCCLWLCYFLIILTYYFWLIPVENASISFNFT